VRLDDIRYLFGYDRWATLRVLAVVDGVPPATWGATGVVGDRGLGSILVHQLGAHQRWRNDLAETGEVPRPEREPLPAPGDLAGAWATEWDALEAWLATLDEAWLERRDENIPFWALLAHVVNHGTQHRSEAATLLTAIGRSPGNLDLIFYAQEIAREGARTNR
jgi:uncharacterized damage-inducible protein DinB